MAAPGTPKTQASGRNGVAYHANVTVSDLARLSSNGEFSEVIEMDVLVARKP
jgi:hypothetical protein